MIRNRPPQVDAILQENAMLARFMMLKQEAETDQIEWTAVAARHEARKRRSAILMVVAAVAFALLPVLMAFASDPRAEASVAVSVSRVRVAQQSHANMPTDFKQTVGAIDFGTVSALEYANAELRSDNEDLHRENKILTDNLKAANGAGKSERKDTATDGNVSEQVLAKQPDAEWTRPPVLMMDETVAEDSPPGNGLSPYVNQALMEPFRVILWGPRWCGYCKGNDRSFHEKHDRRGWAEFDPKYLRLSNGRLIHYTYETGDESRFPKEVLAFAHKHNKWPVWQVECSDGEYVFTNGVRTGEEIFALHQFKAILPKDTKLVAVSAVGGISAQPAYEIVNGATVQPTDTHLLHHGFTAEQIRGMKYEDRCFWHGLAHQLEAHNAKAK